MSPTVDLASVRLTAEVAGGRVRGSMAGLDDYRLEVEPAYYLSSTDASLGQDLSRLGRLLVAQRLQAQTDHDRQHGVTIESFPVGSRYRRELDDYNDAVQAIHDRVESADGAVSISAVGMADVVVAVRPGTLARMPVTEFQRTCEDLTRRLVETHMSQVWRLRLQMFGGDDRG